MTSKWSRCDVMTSHRRHYDLCAWWEFLPPNILNLPPLPPNILNLPTPMKWLVWPTSLNTGSPVLKKSFKKAHVDDWPCMMALSCYSCVWPSTQLVSNFEMFVLRRYLSAYVPDGNLAPQYSKPCPPPPPPPRQNILNLPTPMKWLVWPTSLNTGSPVLKKNDI